MDTLDRLDFYFVRHGITQANREKRYVGWTDVPLASDTDKSLRELKKQLKQLKWHKVFSSDLRRCRQTCTLLSQTAAADERLREMHFGAWEMQTYEALKADPHYRAWLDDPYTVTPSGGESFDAFQHRIKDWLEEQLRSKDTARILTVTHGGVIRQLLLELGAVQSFWEASVPHGKAVFVQMKKREGKWKCMSYSAVPLQENEAT